MNKEPFCHDRLFRWSYCGRQYCLHIQKDMEPLNPRLEQDNIATIACWHRRYDLGDRPIANNKEHFWRKLVRSCVPAEEVFSAAETGTLAGVRIQCCDAAHDRYHIFVADTFDPERLDQQRKEYLAYENITRRQVASKIVKDLTISHCMVLMKPYAEWLPLWICDHKEVRLSASERNPYGNHCDARCIGWAIVLKQALVKKLGRGVQSAWREQAQYLIQSEVTRYIQYLSGENFGYRLYRSNGKTEWEEVDSSWGFLGTDILTNGICDRVACGLREAIANSKCESA